MAYFMVPRFIAFRTELPRTLNQKVEKYRLRQELEADPGGPGTGSARGSSCGGKLVAP